MRKIASVEELGRGHSSVLTSTITTTSGHNVSTGSELKERQWTLEGHQLEYLTREVAIA